MLSLKRVTWTAALLALVAARPASAQASPYISFDDTRLPLLEHLIGRGDIADPSPMVRPFRWADAERVLAAADTAPGTASGRLIHELRESFAADTAKARWQVELRAGGQAFTQRRRDPLHLGGDGGVKPYGDFMLAGEFGPVVGVSRAAIEPRLFGDPDWPNGPRPGRENEQFVGRLIEGYLSAQFKYGALTYGQLLRNWGPVGVPGIPLSPVAYERQGLAIEVGTSKVKLSALGATLRPELNSANQAVNRYYFVHRLDLQVSERLRIAPWESIIIQGVGRTFETPFANPLSLSVLANSFGISDTGSNVMVGLDASWRAGRRTTLQLQGAVDDFWFNDRQQKQDRWALTFAGYGALGERLGWRGWYTQVSSLALRTANPFEDFTDQGVGIGRNWSDMDQTGFAVTIPVRQRWLLSPEVVFQRQGEGRINAPYPEPVNGVQTQPMLFIGTIEYTYRLGLGISGREGPLDLLATAGVHHVTNDQNQPGVTANRFVAQLQATLAWRRRGRL
ncbi:MAG TPA: hypothetical protein VFS11_03595 [Gemmatimonadales bacterium]|nr:hypothetical protein [Gemmatimonadales bacterium]